MNGRTECTVTGLTCPFCGIYVVGNPSFGYLPEECLFATDCKMRIKDIAEEQETDEEDTDDEPHYNEGYD